MSQNTVRRSSTRSGSSTATPTPSPVPAVLAANTANTSDQAGGWPWTSTRSYIPSARNSSSRSVSSLLIWATAAEGDTASEALLSSAKKMPKGDATSIPTRQITSTITITTQPPAAIAAARDWAAAPTALAAAAVALTAERAVTAAVLAVRRAAWAVLCAVVPACLAVLTAPFAVLMVFREAFSAVLTVCPAARWTPAFPGRPALIPELPKPPEGATLLSKGRGPARPGPGPFPRPTEGAGRPACFFTSARLCS